MYSKIIAGTMTWGSWGNNLTSSQISRLIEECVSEGVFTFDHADIYGGYTTEEIFGEAFTKSNIKRDAVQFISKCGIQYLSDTRNNKVKHYEYSKNYIIWSAEESIKKLKTDYLDLFLLHRPSPLMRAEEIAEAIYQLKQNGKILHFGVSNFSPLQTDLIGKYTKVEVNQIECSLTHYHPIWDGNLDYMNVKNIQPMAWRPLGTYFKEENQQTLRIKQQLFTLQNKYNATENQLLLSWLLQHPSGIIPVVGTTQIKRVKELMAATSIQWETEDWFSVLVASQGHKVP